MTARSPLESARAVADAVLFEGYLLYPYRSTSAKNQVRWQWGVLMPEDVVAADPSERAWCRTDVVVDGRPTALRLLVRLLQVQERRVEKAVGTGYAGIETLEVDGVPHVSWDEAIEHELEVVVDLAAEHAETVLEVPGGRETEQLRTDDGAVAGRFVRVRRPLALGVVVRLERPVSPYPVLLVSVRVENRTLPGERPGTTRPEWLRRAAVACHLLMQVDGAGFVSLLDPPEWAAGFAGGCVNEGLFPVLGGPADGRGVVLSSPIILYDHPEIAGESASAFFDSLEIDELLSLRTMTLTDAEKRELRATDARAAGLLDQVESMPDDLWERLHGTVRYLDAMTAPPEAPAAEERLPWWDPGVDAGADPERDSVRVGDVDVARGSRVVLRPGHRRADAHDLFLAGRPATVAGVYRDVDGGTHIAVTLDEDPGADLKLAHGRFLYFAPDEVEPLRSPAVLVACVGNIFKSDDGFGSEVAAALASRSLPDDVRVVDFGIRSVHLVYELLAGYDVLVLVDTVGRQEGPPGTVYLIEPEVEALGGAEDPLAGALIDAHDLSPGGVMELVPRLGGSVERILVVGCQPHTLEDGIGLSEPVRQAVDRAAAMVEDVVRRELDRVRAVTAGRTGDE